MTALSKYQRLECSGLWRATPDAQRREVFVSFGDATLVFSDRNNKPLAHWSLPAIERLNPGARPAVFSPDADTSETLELDDDTMIGAIEKVRHAIARQRPHPGRLRWLITGGIALLIATLAIFWLPGAMVRHTVSVVPESKRFEIGEALLVNVARISGEPCMVQNGVAALKALSARLPADHTQRLAVLKEGVVKSAHLPGGFILLNRALVEDYEEPDVVAGYVLAEQLRAQMQDPLERLLNHAGLRTTFTLLTTGNISDKALAGYAEHLLTRPQTAVSDAALLDRFQATATRASPYAYALDTTGESSIALIEADPFASRPARALLSDGEWVSLQEICE